MSRLSLFPILVVLLAGCHAKFKREAPSVGNARVQMLQIGGPTVQLGYLDTSSDIPLIQAATAVVNVVQAVRSYDVADRIGQAVRPDAVAGAFEQGFAQTLGSGPPFAYNDADEANAVLQIEILSYGVYVPYLGAAGEFTYDMRMRMYKSDGDRIYSAHHTCTASLGDPSVAERVFGVVNNVAELEKMGDSEIQATFEGMARWCGEWFVARMRKHAG